MAMTKATARNRQLQGILTKLAFIKGTEEELTDKSNLQQNQSYKQMK
jgi:hypothetical protein